MLSLQRDLNLAFLYCVFTMFIIPVLKAFVNRQKNTVKSRLAFFVQACYNFFGDINDRNLYSKALRGNRQC